ADPSTFQANAADLFDAIAQGHVAVDMAARYPLDEVAVAHKAAEARQVSGAIVIVPDH
ncbi:MAG TPA: zinc-binding dehydrogenase, partial [Castellaniella sp.]|nr:zinc-binding dehydrogenase [Castellaniella sp.]